MAQADARPDALSLLMKGLLTIPLGHRDQPTTSASCYAVAARSPVEQARRPSLAQSARCHDTDCETGRVPDSRARPPLARTNGRADMRKSQETPTALQCRLKQRLVGRVAAYHPIQ